ncbi:PREDICTED: uncharacterized protein LOC104805234 isoform X1 [Tarenaya hassleriana]|uniref:uncharacterized protein LOC104805234 isoform X2 n=1 Tax=Tarenaya hassleriana TaxID=28532 RepID=UPI00053C6B92|nr:PREDICTED: uncharacterized protein LOC104805234 isoform X2 [Tarenaya hassleriana]XP_010528028.1 PREDICTED: uncharacterized protein LOC104805234 isoform X1 [Tarenaya hassleriana]
MIEREKRAVERNDDVSLSSDVHYYSTSSELPCRKHPSVSAVGICPYCLNDRLVNLVCSECGEQRLSSCSCSDLSPNRSSSAAADLGIVGRISFLIDNEKTRNNNNSNSEGTKPGKVVKAKGQKTEQVIVFERSSSSRVEIKRKGHGLWRIGRFFRKMNPKRDRDFAVKSVYGGGFDEKGDSWGLDYNDGKKMGVSRSRSLCSFRGTGYFVGSEDGSSYSGARSSFSAARRSSSVNGGVGFRDTEPRRSGFEGRKSGFSEAEHRKSGFSEAEPPRRSCFEGRKSNFSETEHRKSNFSEPEPPRRSCFEARKSNFSETEHRRSNYSETEQRRTNLDPRRSNFSESELRKSETANFTRRVFSLKESYFTGGEEPGFIDLKFDFSSSSDKDKQDSCSVRSYRDGVIGRNDGVLDHGGGGSCRITAREREVRKNRRSFKGKGWRWIFGHHHQTVKNRDTEEEHQRDGDYET